MDGTHQVGVEGLSLYGIINFVIVPISNAVVRGTAIDLWTWLGIAAHIFVINTDNRYNKDVPLPAIEEISSDNNFYAVDLSW